MINWLLERLPPVKKLQERWKDLAEAIQLYWEENFYQRAEWARNLRSIYTTDSEGIDLLIAEKGNFFNSGEMDDNEKPIALAMRKYALLHKDRELMLLLTLKYVFTGLEVHWAPLYARKEDTYGDRFYTIEQANFEEVPMTDLFLTCRGMIAVDLKHLTDMGYTLETFEGVVSKEIPKILPLHIVFEGVAVNNKEFSLLTEAFYAGSSMTRIVEFKTRS